MTEDELAQIEERWGEERWGEAHTIIEWVDGREVESYNPQQGRAGEDIRTLLAEVRRLNTTNARLREVECECERRGDIIAELRTGIQEANALWRARAQ